MNSHLLDDIQEKEQINEGNESAESICFDKPLVLKKELEERYKELLGNEGYLCFKEYSSKYIRKSIRVNTLKISVEEIKKRLKKDWILTQVPWCKEGFGLNIGTGNDMMLEIFPNIN